MEKAIPFINQKPLYTKVNTFICFFLLLFIGCNKEEIPPDNTFDASNPLNSFEYRIEVIERKVTQRSNSNVLFVLDSDDLIPIILNEYEALSSTNPLVLIGIESIEEEKRVRDYTPTEINSEESGKAQEFFSFIEQVVIPELERRQIIDSTSKKTIIGHSIGGLATCFAFISYNQVFDNYIALSPSLFWDNFVFFELESNLRKNISMNSSQFFLGIGENEDFGITNGFLQLANILDNHYQNVEFFQFKVNGNHFGSREELIKKSLETILQ